MAGKVELPLFGTEWRIDMSILTFDAVMVQMMSIHDFKKWVSGGVLKTRIYVAGGLVLMAGREVTFGTQVVIWSSHAHRFNLVARFGTMRLYFDSTYLLLRSMRPSMPEPIDSILYLDP
jgi:hypothetical protein